jgi:secreted trypsin-like serine protease
VIAAEWVLTAAHCVIQFGGNTDVSQVRIGSLDRTSGGEVRQAAEFHTHPEFNDAKAPLGDIALIRLSAPVSATPVALAREVPRGSRLRLLGWGLDCANTRTRRGDHRDLPRQPGRRRDACTFDSGGPALLVGRLAGFIDKINQLPS